ncbi:glycosyltransferase family 2 protein [bacterium]|nr:glycosyltransferase family 2 protein [bacterium]
MKNRPRIEILLPIYNETLNLGPLVAALDKSAAALIGEADVHYLFVNDGSSDGSAELLESLAQHRSNVRVVNLIHNFGHSAALACGLDHFFGDILVIMDADLQDSPDAIVPLFEAWKGGAKTVVVERGERKEKTRFLFQAFYFLLHKTAKSLPPLNFGTHCLLDRSVVQRLRDLPERNRYLPGLVAYVSGPIKAVKIDRGARLHGESRVGSWGLIQLAVTALLSFSNFPIRLVSFFGLAASATSLAAGLAFIGIKIFTNAAIPGWASLMTAVAFGSGLQLLCLGLIGEYIARIYDEVKQRPLYLVGQIHGNRAPKTWETGRPLRTEEAIHQA